MPSHRLPHNVATACGLVESEGISRVSSNEAEPSWLNMDEGVGVDRLAPPHQQAAPPARHSSNGAFAPSSGAIPVVPSEPQQRVLQQQVPQQFSGPQGYGPQTHIQQPAGPPPWQQNHSPQGPHFGAPIAPEHAPSIEEISPRKLLRRPPGSGWRRLVYSATGGRVNPGDSAQQRRNDAMIHRVRTPIQGDFRLAVLSLKGGVGKTTTTVGLGATLSSLRGDRVIALDANPDLGTLANRVPQQTESTVRNLLDDPDVSRYSDVRSHTSQSRSRLEVLGSERDPAVSEAFSETDYRKAIDILRNHYNIILTDCGTGLMHSAMKGVLDLAHGIVLVTSPAVDGARSGLATLEWLELHGYGHLVNQAVVVVSMSKAKDSPVDIEQMAQHFNAKARAVQVIPYDKHLAAGAEIDLDILNGKTRTAFLELAATVADIMPSTARRGDV